MFIRNFIEELEMEIRNNFMQRRSDNEKQAFREYLEGKLRTFNYKSEIDENKDFFKKQIMF